MGAPVDLEDVVVEVLNAKAEPCHTQFPNRVELGLGQRAGFALERDLLGRRPGHHPLEPRNQRLELTDREKRRRAAAEIHEVERASGDRRLIGVQLPLATEQIQIRLDFAGVLLRVDPEVTEVAALAAERNM